MTVASDVGEVLSNGSRVFRGREVLWQVQIAGVMKKLEEARSEAEAILALRDEDLGRMFFRETMRRNLSRIVSRLDILIKNGGDDKALGKKALKRLGFAPDE